MYNTCRADPCSPPNPKRVGNLPAATAVCTYTEMSLHNDDRSLSCNSIVLLDSFDV